MIKKKVALISLIFFLSSCGFSSVYLMNNDVNFSIEQVSFTGDRELNNFLKINLSQYKNNKNDNKFFINTKTKYNKIIFSKDGAGEVTNYQLQAEIVFLISPTSKKIKITEKKIMESMSDKFEETEKEKSIKQSFASSITNKLISELIIN